MTSHLNLSQKRAVGPIVCSLVFKMDVYHYLPSPVVWIRFSDLFLGPSPSGITYRSNAAIENSLKTIWMYIASACPLQTSRLLPAKRGCVSNKLCMHVMCISLTEVTSILNVCVTLLDQGDGCINSQKVLKLMRWFKVSNMTSGLNNGPLRTQIHTPTHSLTHIQIGRF